LIRDCINIFCSKNSSQLKSISYRWSGYQNKILDPMAPLHGFSNTLRIPYSFYQIFLKKVLSYRYQELLNDGIKSVDINLEDVFVWFTSQHNWIIGSHAFIRRKLRVRLHIAIPVNFQITALHLSSSLACFCSRDFMSYKILS
jgi:hypothetical protein